MNDYSNASGVQEVDATQSGLPVAAGTDPLSRLEQRWEKLAKSVRDLRSENAALWEQLQGREDQIGRIEQELAQKTAELADKAAEIAALNEEQGRTNARIDELIARFDEIGQ